MMRLRVLIPTDFSKNAFNAIQYAMKLLEKEQCEFFIFHSYYHSGFSKDSLLISEPSEEEQKAAVERAKTNLEKLKVQMEHFEKNENHNFQFSSEFGPFYDLMKKHVQQEDIHLIIMGTQGQSDKHTVILGSNAVNIMEKIRSCPVMAIPSNVRFKEPNEIVFPTSFRSHYKKKELITLVEIARITNSPIRILHIQRGKSLTPAQKDNKVLLETILEPAEFTHHRLFDMAVNDGVRSFVQSRESEMIAFVNKKHNFFGSIFSNPMVKELGMHTKVPLLAMHDSRS